MRIESPKEFPNYYFRDVSLNKLKRITFFENPFKALEKVKKEIITYKREDGLDLSGVLYLPEDASVGDKKPMILWAYPREYKDKSTASQKEVILILLPIHLCEIQFIGLHKDTLFWTELSFLL